MALVSEQPDEEPRLAGGLLKAEDRSGRSAHVFQEEYEIPAELTAAPQEILEESWGENERGKKKWIVAALMIVLILGFASVFIVTAFVNPAEMMPQKTASQNNPVKPELPKAPPTFMDRATPEEVKKAVETTIRGFMNATTHEQRSQFILKGEMKAPKLAEFYSREQAAFLPQGFGKIQLSEPAAFNGQTMVLALAVEKSGKRAWSYSLFPAGDGMKIDWETSVSYGELNWNHFCQRQPAAPTQMRVYLSRIPAFQMTKFSPDDYDAYLMSAFGVPGTKTLRVTRGSPEAEKLSRFVGNSSKHPVNLLLSWRNNQQNEKKIIHLEGVLHNLWTDPSDR